MADIVQPLTWGVTVEEVSALAPHIGIGAPDPTAPVDTVYGGRADRKITAAEVTQWIQDVSSRADVALSRRSRLRLDDNQLRLTNAVHDLVVNGAASYLVAAAFPVKAGLSENSSYSAELWNRFNTGLTALVGALDIWIKDENDNESSPAMYGVGGLFPSTKFPDTIRW